MADLRRLILPFFKSPLLQTILQRRFKYPSYWFLETRAFGARWCRAFAGPRREWKGFLVPYDGRTSSYLTRRFCTINSSICCQSHERSKHDVWALLNGCQYPFGSEDDKRLGHIDCQQSGGGFAAFSGGKWQVWNQKSEKSPTCCIF